MFKYDALTTNFSKCWKPQYWGYILSTFDGKLRPMAIRIYQQHPAVVFEIDNRFRMAHKIAKNSFRLMLKNIFVVTEIEVLHLASATHADAPTQ